MRAGARYTLAGAAASVVLRSIMRTARYDVVGESNWRAFADQAQPVIFSLWHGRLLPLAYHHRRQGVVTLISRSADGEYLARLVQRWGFLNVRGSSSAGASSALREMLRHAREGKSFAITPDGPRGPRERIKPGIIMLAQRTGFPLLPVAAAATRAWWFEGWDRFLVPRPFARIRIAYGTAQRVPRHADGAELERCRRSLEEGMATVMAQVDDRGG